MAGPRRDLGEFLGAARSLVEELRERSEEALRLAGRLGELVGRVSRYEPVDSRAGGEILVEVDPETYYLRRGPHRRLGDYLVIVDLKGDSVVLARVSGVVRRDLLSYLHGEAPADPLAWDPDPLSLTTQALIRVEPLMEAPASAIESGDPVEPVPVTTPIEPQSPVVDPEAWVVERLLNLPGEGLLLGALATPSGLVKEGGVPVRLPYKALLHHTLIIGTTGSGKTTLLKNLAAYNYTVWSGRSPVMVFVDMNQDFIQLPFPPQRRPSGDPVYEAHYRSVMEPQGAVIVVPTPIQAVSEAIEDVGGEAGWCRVAERLAEMHYEQSLQPITGVGVEAKGVVRGGHCLVEARVGRKTLLYVPYALDTTGDQSDELSGLLHGLTMLAKDLLRRTREKYRARRGHYPPLQSITAAIYAYAQYLSRPSRERGDYDPHDDIAGYLAGYVVAPIGREHAVANLPWRGSGESLLDMALDYYEILRESLAHKGTVEALYRRVSSLLDTGLVDIAVAGRGELLIAGEPPWSLIVGEAEARRVPVVLDLRWAGEKGLGSVEGPRLAAYRMLSRLRGWRQRVWAERRQARPLLVVFDEAHQFFPQERGPREEQEASRQVAGMIASIARLGRARGMGLVFATHSPRDLHDIILQLANTKILLRTEKAQLEHLDVPGEAKSVLPRLPDRYMLVLSHVYREGQVLAATPPPVTMHFDLSASQP